MINMFVEKTSFSIRATHKLFNYNFYGRYILNVIFFCNDNEQ